MKKLGEILLVDDSRATNVLNQRLLMHMDIAEKISTALNGREALDYLLSQDDQGRHPSPELIFLDINMPVMNGFQFLESHQKLSPTVQAKQVIVMLTTSINPADRERAAALSEVIDFINKPLTEEAVYMVVEKLP